MRQKNLQLIIIILILAFLGLTAKQQPIQAQNGFDLTLTWSSNAYVPPQYLGKILPTQGSRITVAALTNQPAEALKFKWQLDNTWQNFASGLGRETFSFTAGQAPGFSHRVNLELSYPGVDGDKILAETSIEIPVVNPEVRVYKIEPAKIWPNLTNSLQTQVNLLAGTYTRFIALPYFFNIQKPQDLIYRWYLAGEKTELSADSLPQIFDLEITVQTQSGISRELMLKCNHQSNLSERKTLKINIIVD